MRVMWSRREGGANSNVFAYGLEIKSLFSVLLLRFENGTREAYHSHAFHALSWLLAGRLNEQRHGFSLARVYTPSVRPIVTTRANTHKVFSSGRSWAISFRGPWTATWTELRNGATERVTLAHGRKEIARA